MHEVVLKGRGDFAEWREHARALYLAGVAPEDVVFICEDADAGGLFGPTPSPLPPPGAGARVPDVPPVFMALAEAVLCHSDPRRFALLYRLLWRLSAERRLLDMRTDVDVVDAHQLAKSVRRDYHKMTAFVRFKEMPLAPGEVARRRFISWFEPDHFIVARVAPFFKRRFTDMDWLILTPKGSASWDGDALRVTDIAAEKPDLADDTDDLWKTYYASIFNPARLKVKMMTTEMPRKYWKNLPEAELIPGLIASAETRVIDMAAKAPSVPPAFHHRLQTDLGQEPAVAAGSLEALCAEAEGCTRCPLHCNATQTVFGEGPEGAQVMLVGEQPGDEEDLAGRPFVGPAGRLLNGVLEGADIDRCGLYLTNAVKHFKYEPRGKRRIHQRPNAGEVQTCRWWLQREIELVKPKLVVAMGATALMALTEMRQSLEEVRSRPIAIEDGRTLFVTVHPSYLLRLPDETRRQAEMARFREDFGRIAAISADMKG